MDNVYLNFNVKHEIEQLIQRCAQMDRYIKKLKEDIEEKKGALVDNIMQTTESVLNDIETEIKKINNTISKVSEEKGIVIEDIQDIEQRGSDKIRRSKR